MMKKLGNNFVNFETIDDDETIFFKIGFAIKIEDFRPSHSSSMKLVGQKVDSGGLYRLLQCASKGDKAGVIQELDKGVEPNGADYDRRTAFHLAACECWIEVIDLLLEKGADVNSLDHWGRTVGMDSQAPCFEIDHSEVDMEEATRIGEILAHHFGGWL
ncbi:integrin-linked protein kinase 1 [Gossypium raimondii]|uniref:integrin-linked protein kinase 1 n=1 Tax=Gossypium raimondii TaxID=29730 RepID=UPI00063A8B22|nr:integrin-linked protein kinase 1 [Gossypium raimondii]XP_052478769.1 integrin-linked protein kinase 1 [Gossypium raimondii]XP_052478770.1 integrin-linked protein kinase 1 [Gossypium raimondii]XP_052478771.1 integrin-linked protein kinase 1 [Gossypium raimondii]XP_052478772.1 integrin-linked protein kinase 1 [Gossypium raimondii]XP_052478773.1 integrin-linked protein kinase 1 [Gossypium raimondii]XP_052478774.1 integrin-linked protein kinase 1 [Gossypium raimondii]XP_052478775.1 integrin-l